MQVKHDDMRRQPQARTFMYEHISWWMGNFVSEALLHFNFCFRGRVTPKILGNAASQDHFTASTAILNKIYGYKSDHTMISSRTELT